MKNKTKSGSSTIDAIKMAEGFTFKIVFDCLIQMSNVQLTWIIDFHKYVYCL